MFQAKKEREKGSDSEEVGECGEHVRGMSKEESSFSWHWEIWDFARRFTMTDSPRRA